MPLTGRGDVDEALKKARKELNLTLKGYFVTALTNIQSGTPVDEGRARNNWFLTVGSPYGSYTSLLRGNGNNAAENMPTTVVGKTIYFTNNLPYIERLEYDSWSDQAPGGWVRSELLKLRAELRKANR